MFNARKCLSAMLIAFGLMAGLYAVPTFAADKDAKETKPAAKIDLNKATEEELTDLPGVGDVTAKKIIANRPYKTAEDLTKAGLSETKIAKIAPHLVQEHGAAKAVAKDTKKEETKPAEKKAGEKIDINNATAEELDELPGVGPATAEVIIKGRPYKNEADLVKAGVSQKTADKIAPLISFGKAKAAKEEDPKAAKKVDKKDDKKDDKEVTAKVPPKKGMVWVNTDSKIFHREGDHWYGKTKVGEFMTEEDAIKSGARAVKEGTPAKDKEKDK